MNEKSALRLLERRGGCLTIFVTGIRDFGIRAGGGGPPVGGAGGPSWTSVAEPETGGSEERSLAVIVELPGVPEAVIATL